MIPIDILCGRDKYLANIPVRLGQFDLQVPKQQNPRQWSDNGCRPAKEHALQI